VTPFFHDKATIMEGKRRSYLESLSTEELIRMADRRGIDTPPDLDRVFVIRELLEIEDEAVSAGDLLLGRELPENTVLPKRYNITFIEVLIRDPLWVFVFWEIRNSDRERFEADPDFPGYYLRVLFHGPAGDSGASVEDLSFAVLVGAEDTTWYLGFPPSGGRYRVELCAGDEEKTVLALSRVFTLPRLLDRDGAEEALANPLRRLSGAETLPILRNLDRQSRLRSYET
jgi:hypothetical protein